MKNKILFFLFMIIVTNLNAQNKWGKRIMDFQDEEDGHMASSSCWNICFSSNNKYFITPSGSNIKLWELNSKLYIKKFEAHIDFQAFDFSLDNKLIYSVSEDSIKIWDINLGICIKKIQLDKIERNSFLVFEPKCFSKDKKYLLGKTDSIIAIWDVSNGKLINKISCDSKINTASLSIDGNYIFFGTDSTIKIWNLKTGNWMNSFLGHKSAVNSICESDDMKFIISGSEDSTIKVWEIEKNLCIKTIKVDDAVNKISIFFNENNKKVFYVKKSEKSICQIDLNTDEFFQYDSRSDIFDINNECKYLISIDWYNSIDLFEIRNKSKSMTIKDESVLTLKPKQILLNSFYKDSCLKVLVYSSRIEDSTLQIISLNGDKLKSDTLINNISNWKEIKISENSNYLVIVLVEQNKLMVKLWDIYNNKLTNDFVEKKDNFKSIFIENNKIYIALSDSLKIYNIQKEDTTVKLYKIENINEIIDISLDNNYLLFVDINNQVKSINLNTGLANIYPTNFTKYNREILITPNSKNLLYVYSVDRKILKLSDLATGDGIIYFKGHKDAISCIDISKDGKYILTGSYDSSIKVWDINSGECIKTLVGHENLISNIFFNENNKYIISSSYDTSIKIWNFESGKCVNTITFERDNERNILDLFANGKYAKTTEFDSIKIWDIEKIIKSLPEKNNFQDSITIIDKLNENNAIDKNDLNNSSELLKKNKKEINLSINEVIKKYIDLQDRIWKGTYINSLNKLTLNIINIPGINNSLFFNLSNDLTQNYLITLQSNNPIKGYDFYNKFLIQETLIDSINDNIFHFKDNQIFEIINDSTVRIQNLIFHYFSGSSKMFYGNGKIYKSENYNKNIRNGLYNEYYYNGDLSFSTNFKNGKKNGTEIRYWHWEGGELMSKKQKDDFRKKDTLSKIVSKIIFKDGKANGPYIEYDKGKIKIKGNYYNGLKLGLWEYYDLNKNGREIYYFGNYSIDNENEIKVGEWKYYEIFKMRSKQNLFNKFKLFEIEYYINDILYSSDTIL